MLKTLSFMRMINSEQRVTHKNNKIKQMKTTTRILSLMLFLCLCIYGCKGSKATVVSSQSFYKYSAENFGYSDIKKMYSSDSVNAKRSFFKSESLQYIEMTLQTNIKKTILKTTLDSIVICYQLQNPILNVKRDDKSINLDVIIKDLIKPVFITTNAFGKIGGIKFDSEMSDLTRGLYKDIISRMQFVKPEKNIKDWRTTEENTLGIYTAEYHSIGSEDFKYKKHIKDYLVYKSKKENQKIETDNNTTIETDALGSIKSINTSEALIVLHDKDTLSVLGSKVLVLMSSERLINITEVLILSELEKSHKYSQITTLSEAISDDKIRKMAYKGTLDTDNWETLIQQLSNTKTLTKAKKEELVLKFRAIFYLHSEYCKQAVSLLSNEVITSDIFKILSKALSITETPNAIDALAMIIERNRGDEELLGRLIPVLTTTKYPTDEAIEVIKTLAFSNDKSQSYFTASTAQLALGGMANKLRTIDTLESNKLTHYILESVTSEKDTIQQLLILGNTGSYLVFPRIKLLINSDKVSEDIKTEAISALALINHKNVSNYLKTLLNNEDEYIKTKAQKVLNFQENYFK